MVDFAGWSMPVQFSSIVAEHNATRHGIGLFDISHMGRLEFTGTDALALLDRLVTRRVARLKKGAIRYALVTNQQGGILDDVLVYHLADRDGSSRVLMVVNASNRQKILSWIESQIGAFDAQMADLTTETAMIAVQGPAAVKLVDPQLDIDLASMKYYTGALAQLSGREVVVSRTGYTGEDGCELWVPADVAVDTWQQLLDAGRQTGAVPVGLGARDTLRLEAAMPLYGHELSEQINPFQAGLGFAVQLEDHDFIGADALAKTRDDPSAMVRVGLALDGRRVPREHYAILGHGAVVGEVTSGTFSPTLQRPIAMGYVDPEHGRPGTVVEIDIRNRPVPATIVDLPFYTRPK
jgi:aminomethyltransferase